MNGMRAILLSSFEVDGGAPLLHARSLLDEVVPSGSRVAFVPFARPDHSVYTAELQAALPGRDVLGMHIDPGYLQSADAVFVGGGQTFRLLHELQARQLLAPIRQRVLDGGCAYIGASAGTVIAGPSIASTNCMPIRTLSSHRALSIVPFHINAHYIDPVPGYHGHSRLDRLLEVATETKTTVVALREPAWIDVDSTSAQLHNSDGLLVSFDGTALEIAPGTHLQA